MKQPTFLSFNIIFVLLIFGRYKIYFNTFKNLERRVRINFLILVKDILKKVLVFLSLKYCRDHVVSIDKFSFRFALQF